MMILRTNKLLRRLTFSQFLELLGAAFFNIALLVYAAKMSNPQLATSIVVVANTLPSLVQIGLGYLADTVRDKLALMLYIRFAQFGLYAMLALSFTLTSQEWLLFSIIIAVNFSSDLLSGVTGFAALPVIKHLVSADDLLAARSIQMSVMSLVNVFGQVVGVTILTTLGNNFAHFTVINAMLFLLSGSVILLSKRDFAAKITPDAKPISNEEAPFLASLKQSFATVKQNHAVLNLLVMFALINLLASSIEGLVSLTLLKNAEMYLHNYGITLAIINTALAAGVVLGSFFHADFLKRVKVNTIVMLFLGILALLSLSLVTVHNIYVVITIFAALGYLFGKLSPRVGTYVLNTVEESKLGQTSGFMNTLMTLSVPLGQLIFLSLANGVSVSVAWIALLVTSVSLIGYALYRPLDL
jgi:MFS family permease